MNEVFDPEHVSEIFNQNPDERVQAILRDKATNYSVVRIELLEQIYHKLYMQGVKQPDKQKQTRRIITNAETVQAEEISEHTLRLSLRQTPGGLRPVPDHVDANYILTGTGYQRNAHVEILKNAVDLLPQKDREEKNFAVGRDYRVKFDEERVPSECGVWLQGCNEATHGVSDFIRMPRCL